ncbi:MAG: RNA-binding protein [Candidatus Obscuribacterales bacterium]|nr:RNA-binding protein [Candidatus Obscuribacterales bacterium]
MSTKIYLGNLPFSYDEERLTELLSETGEVVSLSMPTDRETGRRRGFAFAEMKSPEDAQKTIDKLNGLSVDGRAIVVNIARPREPRSGGGRGRD